MEIRGRSVGGGGGGWRSGCTAGSDLLETSVVVIVHNNGYWVRLLCYYLRKQQPFTDFAHVYSRCRKLLAGDSLSIFIFTRSLSLNGGVPHYIIYAFFVILVLSWVNFYGSFMLVYYGFVPRGVFLFLLSHSSFASQLSFFLFHDHCVVGLYPFLMKASMLYDGVEWELCRSIFDKNFKFPYCRGKWTHRKI